MHSSLTQLRTHLRSVLRLGVLAALASTALAGQLGESTSPLKRVQAIFPRADRCELYTRVIGSSRRTEIEALLPPGVGYHDLGTRVVYSAMRGSSPLGLLHIRHETGEWGLVQIAWKLNLDFTINDFTLVRCRETERETIESEEFRRLLRFKGVSDLKQLLSADGSFDGAATSLPRDAQPLAGLIVTSALRTLALAEVGSARGSSSLMIRRSASISFPDLGTLAFKDRAFSPAVLEALEADGLPASDLTLENSLLFAQGFDRDDQLVGSFVHVSIQIESRWIPVLFTVVGELIEKAVPLTSSASSAVHSQLTGLCGQPFEVLAESKSPVSRIAALALRLAQHSEKAHVSR